MFDENLISLYSKFHYLKQEVLRRTNSLLSFDTARIQQKTTRPTILLSFHVYSLPR
jgi:hypothetical protein